MERVQRTAPRDDRVRVNLATTQAELVPKKTMKTIMELAMMMKTMIRPRLAFCH